VEVPALTFRPLTPDLLPDLEALFGPRGACAGCFCMWWKTSRADFHKGQGAGNRAAMRRQVRSGVVPGVLAYLGKTPVGWCAVEPRSAYPRLARSRILAPVDDAPVWSVTCFFIAREHRGKGLTGRLLRAAAAHARGRGARLLEAYPVDTRREQPDAFLYHGVARTFFREGFEEVARRSRTRPIMRKALTSRRPAAPRGHGLRDRVRKAARRRTVRVPDP